LKGDATNWLTEPEYAAFRLRLEVAHAATEAALEEARRRVRLNEEIKLLRRSRPEHVAWPGSKPSWKVRRWSGPSQRTRIAWNSDASTWPRRG